MTPRDRTPPPFPRIGIIGLGLMGGSIALAARERWPEATVVGTPSRRGPLPGGMLDRVVDDIAVMAGSVDLIVLAMPVSAMGEVMRTLAASGTTAVVTDVGSTKRRVIAAAREAGLVNFVGGHPMAGGEKPGAGEARADLFVGRPWLLVEGTANSAAHTRLEAFVGALGAVSRWMPADEHDRTVAYVSHLPQVVAAALMNAAETAVALNGPHVAGNAFSEMTRLASSPPGMWQGICADNADFVAEALQRFLDELPNSGQEEEAGRWVSSALERSGAARDRWKGARRTGASGDS